VIAGGNLSLTNNAKVTGTAYVAGTASVVNNSTIGGGVHQLSHAPSLCGDGYDFDAAMALVASSNHNKFAARALR
jgi:hypothetical protein